MSSQPVRTVDGPHGVLATALVTEEGGRYGGTIDLRETPARVRALFDEFEEVVNGQMFSLLDEVQEKIAALASKAVFADGQEASVEDLQVYPRTGEVTFKRVGAPSPGAKMAGR